MAVNKVEINGATVLDLTSDTVTEQSLLKGVIAHNRSGEKIAGIMESSGLSLPTYRTNNFAMSEGVATFTILSSANDSVNLNLNAFVLVLSTLARVYKFPAILVDTGTEKRYQAATIGSSGLGYSNLLALNTATNIYTWALVDTLNYEDQDLYNGNIESTPLIYSLETL